MTYNLAIFKNCTGFLYCLAKGANDLTNGIFWLIFLLGFGIIIFLATYNYGTNRSFGFASISCALLSLMLVTLGFISWFYATIFLITGAIGLVAMIISER